MTQESARLDAARDQHAPWRKWGPYLSERQWGTVREDYSADGSAWDYFTHDQARSRAYRWGEDGIGGISDDKQQLCFALALWNGHDPIIKERMFGLTNAEGNHGEDVKEYYYYLDSTPTHSYMKFLYKYPHAAYPYDDLVKTNRTRPRNELEYELIDTGVFDDDRYFDVLVEYAKESPEDVLITISVTNRGSKSAKLRVLPTIWFRNTWSFEDGVAKPRLRKLQAAAKSVSAVAASHPELGDYTLSCAQAPSLLFTENETNRARVFGETNASPWVKDGINNYVVHGNAWAVNPGQIGTKAAADYQLDIPAGQTQVVRLRLTRATGEGTSKEAGKGAGDPFGSAFEQTFSKRRAEADEFYRSITPPASDGDRADVMRQAIAGMLWSKQFFYYDLSKWIKEHRPDAAHGDSRNLRNGEWFHMLNCDIISMPDKWEYPWYAAWDLAFHCIPLAMVDPDFAKQQLQMMLREHYLHPNGQIPAYEWNFGDVNPPVHAWATLYVYNIDKNRTGKGDVQFLKSSFQKLLLNFTWWVNRKDRSGKNVFEGGFLGLDNIGVFDRSAALPTGGCLEQADGTAWMAFFSHCMFEIALELAAHDATFQDLAMKFLEHFLWIGAAMDRLGEHDDEMWDEKDGFYYDVLRMPDGTAMRLKVRSLVGLLPMCATTVISPDMVKAMPQLAQRVKLFLERHPEVVANIAPLSRAGVMNRRLLGLLDEAKLRRVLSKMLDENEFFSPHGIRSLSKFHEREPYIFAHDGNEFRVDYAPAESTSGMFGGNSNWRGPIWMPVNLLLVRSLLKLYAFYGDEFKIECPTGSGQMKTLFEVAHEIGNRLIGLFTRDKKGRRPVFGDSQKFQSDPHWRDHLLFYEYFHGDNGAGIGASHQTGWTGAVAFIIQFFDSVSADAISKEEHVTLRYRREESAVPSAATSS